MWYLVSARNYNRELGLRPGNSIGLVLQSLSLKFFGIARAIVNYVVGGMEPIVLLKVAQISFLEIPRGWYFIWKKSLHQNFV